MVGMDTLRVKVQSFQPPTTSRRLLTSFFAAVQNFQRPARQHLEAQVTDGSSAPSSTMAVSSSGRRGMWGFSVVFLSNSSFEVLRVEGGRGACQHNWKSG